jgi:hypothetical protein
MRLLRRSNNALQRKIFAVGVGIFCRRREDRMRELFENAAPDNPMEAARRAARPMLRKRFYERASTAPEGKLHAVRLDDKPVRTPAGHLLAVPTLARAARHDRPRQNAAHAARQFHY